MAVKGLRYRASVALVPPLYVGLSKLLFATCREETQGLEHYQRLLDSGQPFIACLWHYSIFYGIHRIKGRDWVIMVSTSDDAEYVSRTLTLMGHQTVRGSRNKGGMAAVKEMLSVIKKERKRAAIVGDGSQGPPLVLQPGIILLASRTGAPILPLAWGADRYWRFKSWDRTAIPKPFAKVSMCFDEPMTVPPGISAEESESYRLTLEGRMHDLYARAWQPFGPRRPEPSAAGLIIH